SGRPESMKTPLPTITAECSVVVVPPTATDNCAGLLVGKTLDRLTYTNQGTFTVHWTYDDGHGNLATQEQTVVVQDTSKPVPTLATLPVITGQCSATLTPPTATDTCAGLIVGKTLDPLIYTNQVTSTVHWTYDDGHGNVATQEQTVVV